VRGHHYNLAKVTLITKQYLTKVGLILLRMLGFGVLAGVAGGFIAYANLTVYDPRQPPNPTLTGAKSLAYEWFGLWPVVEIGVGAIAGAAIGLVLGACRGRRLLLVSGGVLTGMTAAILLLVLLPLPAPVRQPDRDMPFMFYALRRFFFVLEGAFTGLALGLGPVRK
jgi:hypothetical protein